MRLLFWLALAALVWIWLTRPRKSGAPDFASRPANAGAEPMLQCRHCQVYFPASEAVTDSAGRTFCSKEHSLAST